VIRIKDGKKLLLFAVITTEVLVILFLFSNYFEFFAYRLGIGYLIKTNLETDNATPRYLPEFLIPSNDSVLEKELKPNFSQLFDGYTVRFPNVVNVTINSDGFRGKDYSLEKPNNTIRILVLGDSVAFGWGVNDNETFPVFLEKMLNKDSQKKYEVLNLAVPGYNTKQEVEMLKTKGLKYSPDLIIIAYHRNDILNNTEEEEMADFYYQKISANATEAYNDIPEGFVDLREKYLQIISKNSTISDFDKHMLGGWWADIIINDRTLDDYDKSRWNTIYIPWRDLYNLTKQRGLKVIIFTGIEMFQDDYHRKVMERIQSFFQDKVLPNKSGWYLIDFQPTVMKYPREELVVEPREGHPNPFGHELMAKEIYSFIKEKSLAE
jgi:lysophospholipase L1-like esterase